MTNWLLRGLVFAAAMVVLRVIQGALIYTWQSQSWLISLALAILFVIATTVWGLFDGRTDATENPDPDRRRDLAMTWLIAGLVAGVLGGAVTWLISLFDKAVFVGGLINELTTIAALTALMVFVPAMIGVVVGRWLVDRQYAKVPQRHHGLAAAAEDRADTDVFAAVSTGGESTAPAAGGEAPTAGWTTEEFPVDTEETTAGIPTEDENPDDRRS
ncbi:MAG: B-4DMT family transporter [Mycobacterium sp.]